MPTDKISLSLDEDLVDEARRRVGPRGLSRYVNHALHRQLQHDRLGALLEELEREHGPVDPKVVDEVARLWPGRA